MKTTTDKYEYKQTFGNNGESVSLSFSLSGKKEKAAFLGILENAVRDLSAELEVK